MRSSPTTRRRIWTCPLMTLVQPSSNYSAASLLNPGRNARLRNRLKKIQRPTQQYRYPKQCWLQIPYRSWPCLPKSPNVTKKKGMRPDGPHPLVAFRSMYPQQVLEADPHRPPDLRHPRLWWSQRQVKVAARGTGLPPFQLLKTIRCLPRCPFLSRGLNLPKRTRPSTPWTKPRSTTLQTTARRMKRPMTRRFRNILILTKVLTMGLHLMLADPLRNNSPPLPLRGRRSCFSKQCGRGLCSYYPMVPMKKDWPLQMYL